LEFLKTIAQATAQLEAGWRNELGFPSFPLLSHGSLLVKVYAPRGNDLQTPHTRDEVYVVARGSGEFVCGEVRNTFAETDLLFVPAGKAHRFENFSDDLTLWVIFYGPEGGERPVDEPHKYSLEKDSKG
jgi:mannose-6-phosphate isomerase-like protein (cupin superfamily)